MAAQSPWTRRAQSRTLPPIAHGARAYAGREPIIVEPIALDTVRLDIRGQSWTVADLQRAIARESAER